MHLVLGSTFYLLLGRLERRNKVQNFKFLFFFFVFRVLLGRLPYSLIHAVRAFGSYAMIAGRYILGRVHSNDVVHTLDTQSL